MEFSATLRRSLLNPFHLEARNAAFAVLVSSGYFTQADAFAILFNPISTSNYVLSSKGCEVAKGPATSRLINFLKPLIHKDSKAASEEEAKEENKEGNVGDFTTKESILQVLSDTLSELRGKEKADVAMKIADLMQMKREVAEADSTRIHFYIPLQCFRCALYQRFKQQHKP